MGPIMTNVSIEKLQNDLDDTLTAMLRGVRPPVSHTPGPWHNSQTKTLPMQIAGDTGTERAANLIMLRAMAGIRNTKQDLVDIINEQTAAPDMLEALKEIVENIDYAEGANRDSESQEKATDLLIGTRAIIAEAEGRAS